MSDTRSPCVLQSGNARDVGLDARDARRAKPVSELIVTGHYYDGWLSETVKSDPKRGLGKS
jgi:hypothetical protein